MRTVPAATAASRHSCHCHRAAYSTFRTCCGISSDTATQLPSRRLAVWRSSLEKTRGFPPGKAAEAGSWSESPTVWILADWCAASAPPVRAPGGGTARRETSAGCCGSDPKPEETPAQHSTATVSGIEKRTTPVNTEHSQDHSTERVACGTGSSYLGRGQRE